jgi:hypothetical protein
LQANLNELMHYAGKTQAMVSGVPTKVAVESREAVDMSLRAWRAERRVLWQSGLSREATMFDLRADNPKLPAFVEQLWAHPALNQALKGLGCNSVAQVVAAIYDATSHVAATGIGQALLSSPKADGVIVNTAQSYFSADGGANVIVRPDDPTQADSRASLLLPSKKFEYIGNGLWRCDALDPSTGQPTGGPTYATLSQTSRGADAPQADGGSAGSTGGLLLLTDGSSSSSSSSGSGSSTSGQS